MQYNKPIQRLSVYTVRTTSGVCFSIEATSLHQAQQRASHPAVAKYLARLILEAVSQVEHVEHHRGPSHTAKGVLLTDERFA
jgi:hypothetical protein